LSSVSYKHMLNEQTGITFNSEGFALALRGRVMNITCIISCLLALLSAYIGADSEPYMYSLIALSGVFGITLLLNNVVKRIPLTEFFVTFATTVWIIFMCISFPATLGEQNYLIIALVALAIFSNKVFYRTVAISALILVALALNLYQRYYPPLFTAPAAVDFLFAVNVVTPLSIIAIMCQRALKNAVASQKVIEQQRRQLEESNRFKDKVFSIIGHDMRSPFNSTLGLISALEADLLTVEERKTALQELRSSIATSLQTLDNILGWASQGYYGSILNAKTHQEPLCVHDLVSHTTTFHNPLAAAKQITFINNADSDVLVHADKEQMSFVFRNLTSNAIKFSRIGQSITFETKQAGKEVIVSICDQGIGMTGKMIDSLFKIATRFTTEGTMQEKGTGLGLIFCKEFIVNNNGRLWVESKPGEGTKVFFALQSGR
jgi:two-component system sensor histidine kinase/response regulator